MKKSSLFVFIFSIFLIPLCFAEESSFGSLKPAQVIENEDSEGIIIIDSNVSGAEVYINGEYKGRTKLEITDLVPGLYNIKLVKSGYAETSVSVWVRKGYTNVYVVEMGKEVGYINLANITSDCEVYLDGQRLYVNPIEAMSGSHVVVVKRFGYESFSKDVDVKAGKTIYLTANLVKTGFKAENLVVSKKTINPKYKNSAGSCIFGFEAAASGNVVFEIKDEKGRVVWTKQISDLNKREQSIKWDGRNESGEILEDGDYSGVLRWDGGELAFAPVKIDTGLTYPLVCAGKEGSSLGSVPIAGSKIPFVMPYLSFGTVFVSGSQNALRAVPVSFGAIGNLNEIGEISLAFTAFPVVKNLDTPFLISGSYKYTWQDLLNSREKNLSVSAYLRYGYSSFNYASYCYDKSEDYGKIDFGAGLGTGTSLTYERNKITGVYSFAMVFAPESGKMADLNQYIYKNSLAGSYEFTKQVKAYASGTLVCIDSFEADFGVLLMPFSNTIVINSEIQSVFAKENVPYFGIRISLSYLL